MFYSEATVCRCSSRHVLLEIWQIFTGRASTISKERDFWEYLFHRTSLENCVFSIFFHWCKTYVCRSIVLSPAQEVSSNEFRCMNMWYYKWIFFLSIVRRVLDPLPNDKRWENATTIFLCIFRPKERAPCVKICVRFWLYWL